VERAPLDLAMSLVNLFRLADGNHGFVLNNFSRKKARPELLPPRQLQVLTPIFHEALVKLIMKTRYSMASLLFTILVMFF
jgi:hypothetical protein